MLQECNQIHLTNYNETCCLRHLIEMSEQAEMQTLTNKYAKLLLQTLNRLYKNNMISFEGLKLDFAKTFLDILSKYISHFYFLNKFDYAKLLVKVALKAYDDTPYRDHPDIIMRACAVHNNIACIFEKERDYKKSLRHLTFYKKYATANIDRMILYNNLMRINYLLGKVEEAEDNLKYFSLILKDEISSVRNEKFFKTGISGSIINPISSNSCNNLTFMEIHERDRLLAFLSYNYGISLEVLNKESEAREAFKRGYEFSVCMLGEYNLSTSKFLTKIAKNQHKGSFASLSSSIFKNESVFSPGKRKSALTDSLSKNQAKDNEAFSRSFATSAGPVKLLDAERTFDNIKSNESDLLSNKLDAILQHLEQMGKANSKEVLPSTEHPRASSAQAKHVSSLKNEKLLKMIEPSMKSLCSNDSLNTESNDKNRELIEEVMKEYQEEKKSGKIVIKRRNNSSLALSSNSNQMNNRSISRGSADQMNGKISSQPKIKLMFEKVLNAKVQPKKNPIHSGGMFTEIVGSLISDSPNPKPSYYKQTNTQSSNVVMDPDLRGQTEETENIIELKPYASQGQESIIDLDDLDKKPSPSVPESDPNNKKKISISINLEKDDTNYEFVPFYFKDQSKTVESDGPISPVSMPEILQRKVRFVKANAGNIFANTFVSKLVQQQKKKEEIAQKSNELKESLASQLNKMRVQVSIDAEPDKYECKTLIFFSNQVHEDPMIQDNLQKFKNKVKLMINEYKNDSKKLISEERSFEEFENETNLITYKRNQDKSFDSMLLFEHITKDILQTTKTFSILRMHETGLYKILITCEKNAQGCFGLALRLTKETDDSEILNEVFIELTKLKVVIGQLFLLNVLPKNYDLNQISSMDYFIQKVFIFYCSVIKKSEKLNISIMSKPKGLCTDNQIIFKFLKTNCYIDIIVIENNETRIIIYNAKNDSMCFQIDCILDQDCFAELLEEIPTITNSNQSNTKAYRLYEKHIGKNGFITYLTQKIQEVLKIKLQDNDLSLEKALQKLQVHIFQCTASNLFQTINLWIISYQSISNTFSIDYHSLTKLKINNEDVCIKKSLLLSQDNLHKLFGNNLNQIMENATEREKTIICYLILNSFSYRRVLTDTHQNMESLDMFDIQQINPPLIFSFSFVFSKEDTKLLFKLKSKLLLIANFDFLFYNKMNYFFRLSLYNPITTKSLMKIFIPKISILLPESLTFGADSPSDEAISAMIKDHLCKVINEDRKRTKTIIMDYVNYYLLGESNLNIFDSGDNILSKFV